jgi:hypothetical protein
MRCSSCSTYALRMLYLCVTNALLMLYICLICRAGAACGAPRAVLMLCLCFTFALQMRYLCFTYALYVGRARHGVLLVPFIFAYCAVYRHVSGEMLDDVGIALTKPLRC